MTAVNADAESQAMTQGFPPIVRFRFELEASESARLPAYAGSAWRGLLGHSLRRTVCVTRQPTCQGCLLTGTCAYSVFFESPSPSPESANRYTALPHPYVLDVDVGAERDVAAGAELSLGMNLIGPAIDLLPYLIQTMDRAGERGIGRAGGRFALRSVVAERGLGSGIWDPVYDAESGGYQRPGVEGAPLFPPLPGAIELEFQTPLRVKHRGHFVGAREFAAEDLLRNLLVRLSRLAAIYGDNLDPFDWRQVAPHAEQVALERSHLTWSDWVRYSSRQHTRMQLGGLVGEITLDGPGLAAFWPALWLGQWTHVGKGTSFGLGKYRVAAGTDRETKHPQSR